MALIEEKNTVSTQAAGFHRSLTPFRYWIVAVLAWSLSVARGEDHPTIPSAPAETLASGTHQGFLYGQVTDTDGTLYQGRLRFAGDEEAFWNETFNGVKADNPWARHVPRDQLSVTRPRTVLGMRVGERSVAMNLVRPLMVRFGDIRRIEAHRRDIRVTLKNGRVIVLDRFEADDLADGLRIWDVTRGVVDLDEWSIRAIDFLPAPARSDAPLRLHATVQSTHGSFSGTVQWNREQGVASDVLIGRTDASDEALRFDTISSIERLSTDQVRVTLRDGQQRMLPDGSGIGRHHRGIYVHDARFGRVLVSWHALIRMDLAVVASGPGYASFTPGQPLQAEVLTRSGQQCAGRLVFDLDESETIDTLDAPDGGVDYSIPFDRIAVIEPDHQASARISLHSGEVLQLQPAGDLGEGNAGLLVFATGSSSPDYIRWQDVERITLATSSPKPHESDTL